MLKRLYSTRKEPKVFDFAFFRGSRFLSKYLSLFIKLHGRFLFHTILHKLFLVMSEKI